ncbi:DUF6317 family protein [Streptomyces sp. TS71-3]|uniref:DUF6317 family protein n=1 Tax=Streptomyces sp. TS71-3 TaxID=2733862 RepID=UPI001B158AC5|nr:DUF6317 family protein [Streptomyces sp. TS71-3]GHJ36513.1 hypothetical protein Sm713_21220 [Streptomyces sp. TS71-3]
MADFKAVLGDLTSMSATFHREAGNYRGLHAQVAPPVVSGGDGGLDHAIKEVADLIVALHTGFADRLDDHGDRVAYATASFRRHDIDVHGLFEDLMVGEG